MDTPTFRKLLRALKTLTPCQLRHLDEERQLQTDNETRLDKRLAAEFAKHPVCPHCKSEMVYRWGSSSNQRQRYRCRDCNKSFNSLTKMPLSKRQHPEKWDSTLRA